MGQSDPALTYLRKYGYSVVRLPKADIKPLQLLARDGKELKRLGPLDSLFRVGTVPSPDVDVDVPAADIKSTVKTTLSVGLAMSLLGNFLKAMGGKALGLDVAYKKAQEVTFEFTDLLSDSCDVNDVDKFLGAADVDPNSRHVATLLDADEVFVVISTLKTKQFTVEARAETSKKVAVSIPEIKGIVGSEVSVSADSTSESKISYGGNALLVFGFNAIRLEYDGGRYKAFTFAKAGGHVMAKLSRTGGRRTASRLAASNGRKRRTPLVETRTFARLEA